MRAIVVCDLGFGDAGKGTITDYLVRETGSKLVVRYNGGAQAGHTVVLPDGRAHTFAQFGSGTFVPGVRTYLSRFMLVHPTGLLVEAKRLEDVGVRDALARLVISPDARIITPFHQAANRLREIERGSARHGSCGIGVGETAKDSIDHPADTITMRELADARTKLLRVRERKRAELAHLRDQEEFRVLEDDAIVDRWLDTVRALRVRVEELAIRETAIFEGAHGVLLDEWRGFHPHTTWSTCTFEHALDLLREFQGDVERVGVLRTYATRHGPGPFPTEARLDLPEPHNPTGAWQGAFRVGHFDAVLARYAIAACGKVDALAITHLDRVTPGWKIATRYEDLEVTLGPPRDLDWQEKLGARVARARPVYEETSDVLSSIERATGVPVRIVSRGPTYSAKQTLEHVHGR